MPGHAAPEDVDVETRLAVLVHFVGVQFVPVDRVLEFRESGFAITRVGIDNGSRLIVVGITRDGIAAVGHGECVDLFLGYTIAAVGRTADLRGSGDDARLVAAGDAGVDFLHGAGFRTYRREKFVEAAVGVFAVGADQGVEVQIHHVFGGLGGLFPLLFIVLGREKVVAVFVDDSVVEVVAVEELAGRVEQQTGAGRQGGAFGRAAVMVVRPTVGQPFRGLPEFGRHIIDAFVPRVALAFVESGLGEVHRVVADEEDGTVDGQHHGVKICAQEAGFVVVIALVGFGQFGTFVNMLHKIVGLADTFVHVVVRIVAECIGRRVPRIVIDGGISPVQVAERGFVRAGFPRNVVVGRNAGRGFVVGLPGVDVCQVLKRGALFFEDIFRSQRFVGLTVEVRIAGSEQGSGGQEQGECLEYVFHDCCRLGVRNRS